MPSLFQPSVIPPHEIKEPAWWFMFRGNRMLVKLENDRVEIPSIIDPGELELDFVRRQYLGRYDDQDLYSAEISLDAAPPSGWIFQSLRRLYPLLSEDLVWIAGTAVQIVDWDRSHQYCGRCGSKTFDKRYERAKECPQCGLISYPRISPAIIVLVERDDTLLLARAHRHPPSFYSVLAGFVEPGETLEEAVAREIMEEVGIEVADIQYFGSQPWPFPNSLMIAFTCTYASGDIKLEDEEIEDAGWYTADNLPQVPPKISIARKLIDWFVEEHTP